MVHIDARTRGWYIIRVNIVVGVVKGEPRHRSDKDKYTEKSAEQQENQDRASGRRYQI